MDHIRPRFPLRITILRFPVDETYTYPCVTFYCHLTELTCFNKMVQKGNYETFGIWSRISFEPWNEQ